MQGRFSGRLVSKDDERKLVEECRLLAPLLSNDGTLFTLPAIVRAMASGEVRAHLEQRKAHTSAPGMTLVAGPGEEAAPGGEEDAPGGEDAPGDAAGDRKDKKRRRQSSKVAEIFQGLQMHIPGSVAQHLAGYDAGDLAFPGGSVRVLAGQLGEVRGPVEMDKGCVLDVRVEAGREWRHAVPAGWRTAALTVYEGSGELSGQLFGSQDTCTVAADWHYRASEGGDLTASAGSDGLKMLLGYNPFDKGLGIRPKKTHAQCLLCKTSEDILKQMGEHLQFCDMCGGADTCTKCLLDPDNDGWVCAECAGSKALWPEASVSWRPSC